MRSLVLWLRFAHLFRPYRGRLTLTFFATLARPLLNAAKIYLLKLIVDNLAQHPSGSIVAVIGGGYLVISLLKGVASFGDDYLGVWVGGRVIFDLRQLVFARFLRLSPRYHSEHRVGGSVNRLISDVGAVEAALISGLTDGLAQTLTVIIYAGMCSSTSIHSLPRSHWRFCLSSSSRLPPTPAAATASITWCGNVWRR